MPRQRTHYSRITYVFPDYSLQRWSSSRKNRACRGRRLPAALGPIAPPYGAGLKPGSGPTCQHRKALVKLADSLGLGHLFTA